MNLRRLFVVLAVLAPLAVVTALPAAAHVELAESQPGAGATVTTPPAEIFLRFTGPVEEDSVEIRVTGPDGERVDVGQTQSGARAAAAELPELGGNGRYVVRYEGTSEDGHAFEGRLRFRLRVEQEPETTTAAPADDATAPATETGEDPAATQPPVTDAAPTSDTGSGVPWAPIAAVIAIVLVAVIALAVRRRA